MTEGGLPLTHWKLYSELFFSKLVIFSNECAKERKHRMRYKNFTVKNWLGNVKKLWSVFGNWEKLLSEISEISISETKLDYDNPYTNHLYMWNPYTNHDNPYTINWYSNNSTRVFKQPANPIDVLHKICLKIPNNFKMFPLNPSQISYPSISPYKIKTALKLKFRKK